MKESSKIMSETLMMMVVIDYNDEDRQSIVKLII